MPTHVPTARPRVALFLLLVATTASPAFAQTRWSQRFPTAGPSPRTAHALAYHAGVQRTVLFGGCDNVMVCHDDTWLWDGTAWTAAGSGGPAPRYGHAMVYDSARDRLVLFGGGNVQNQLFGDTWEWDGAAWTQRATTGPAPRWNHGMAYDPLRRRVVMFGGNTLATSFGDTWEWDGTHWRAQAPDVQPSARMGPAMGWDGSTGRVALFGGFEYGAGSRISSDTWLWDGRNWEFRNFSFFAARYAAAMVWDEARGRLVLFGGTTLFGGVGYNDDTLEWEGSTWLLRSTSAPPARAWAPLAYDPVRREVVMFGGNNAQILGDTQVYATPSPATFSAFGAGCVGTAGTPALAAPGSLPWEGEVFTVELSGLPAASPAVLALGVSRTRWGPLALPLLLGPLAPGCSVLASQEVVLPLSNPAGTASGSLVMPLSARGATFYLQGLVVDPSHPLPLGFSNGGEATVGAK